MLLRPNRTKFNKSFKGKRNSKYEIKANELKFGIYGIQALEKGRITARQIESVRRTIAGLTKRKSKVWIRVYPSRPITKKPAEVRMGKGKGNVSFWVCNINPGRILFEIAGNDHLLLQIALIRAIPKIPFKVRIIKRITKV